MRIQPVIKIFAILLLCLLCVAVGAIAYYREIGAFVAGRYGYRIVPADIFLDITGGRLGTVVAPTGVVLEDISWRWRYDNRPLFPFTPDIQIARLKWAPPAPDSTGPNQDINPIELLRLLSALSLPVGRVTIEQVMVGDGQGAVVVNSPGNGLLTIDISRMALSVGGVHISGSLNLDWNGQKLVCAGTIQAMFDKPKPILGAGVVIAPSCQTDKEPHLSAVITPQGLKPNDPAWRKINITVPIGERRPDRGMFELMNGQVVPPISGNIVIKQTSPLVIDAHINPINGDLINQPVRTSAVLITMRSDTINVGAMTAKWGEAGEIKIDPVAYDMKAQAATGMVTIHQINSAPILARWPIKGLYFEGIFDGVLPFHIERTIVTIKNGYVTAKNGIVRYVPKTPVAGQLSELGGGIALVALEDFHFDDLKITLNGVQGADQAVEMTLSGRNPALYDGYPVVMRVNLSGALEDLLREGQATMSLTDRLKLEQRQKNKHPPKDQRLEPKP